MVYYTPGGYVVHSCIQPRNSATAGGQVSRPAGCPGATNQLERCLDNEQKATAVGPSKPERPGATVSHSVKHHAAAAHCSPRRSIPPAAQRPAPHAAQHAVHPFSSPPQCSSARPQLAPSVPTQVGWALGAPLRCTPLAHEYFPCNTPQSHLHAAQHRHAPVQRSTPHRTAAQVGIPPSSPPPPPRCPLSLQLLQSPTLCADRVAE